MSSPESETQSAGTPTKELAFPPESGPTHGVAVVVLDPKGRILLFQLPPEDNGKAESAWLAATETAKQDLTVLSPAMIGLVTGAIETGSDSWQTAYLEVLQECFGVSTEDKAVRGDRWNEDNPIRLDQLELFTVRAGIRGVQRRPVQVAEPEKLLEQLQASDVIESDGVVGRMLVNEVYILRLTEGQMMRLQGFLDEKDRSYLLIQGEASLVQEIAKGTIVRPLHEQVLKVFFRPGK